MNWDNLSQWQQVLAKSGFQLSSRPRPLTKIKFGENLSAEIFTLAFEDQRPVVVHCQFSVAPNHSDVKSLLRRAYGQGISASPCLISYGTDSDLGIYVCTDQEEYAFQFVDMSSPDAINDIVKDMLLAKSKTTTSEKVTTIFKALDFESLSSRFFDSASQCKTLIEKDIFTSTRLAKNSQNEQNVSHYAIIVMARMIFLHFLEQKQLLNHDIRFIRNTVEGDAETDLPPTNGLWSNFFKPLFEILNLPTNKRRGQTLNKFDFPYLNGGLFACYDSVEGQTSFDKLKLSDECIRTFYKTCLYKYRMMTTEDTARADQRGVLDPELLGTIFERFMKDDVSAKTGSVYTPKDVVLYSVRNALTRYFKGAGLPEKTAFDLIHFKKVSSQFADVADKYLTDLRLTDPCCGSGAFLLTSLHELFEVKRAIRLAQGKERWHNGDQRRAYESILKENIYGMDINPEAIILCHLRMWLPIIDLIDGTTDYSKIQTLPNLGLNIRCGNSLIHEQGDWESGHWQEQDIRQIAELRNKYFSSDSQAAAKILATFDEVTNQDDSYVRFTRNFLDITMSKRKGFSVIVGNPPYLGAAETSEIKYLKNWEDLTGGKISDMYIMFTHESLKALTIGGVLSYVTSNTYFTDNSKESFRKLLLGQSSELPTSDLTITNLSNKTFKGVEVSAAIFTLNKRAEQTRPDTIRFVHASPITKSVNGHLAELNDDPTTYDRRSDQDLQHVFTDIPVSTIHLIPKSNLFIPNRERIAFLNRFGEQWRRVYDDVWPLIETAPKAKNNFEKLHKIRQQLKPGDLTLIGLVTDGGRGVDTGCNAVHLALLEGSEEAIRTKKKIEKIKSDIISGNKSGKRALQNISDIREAIKSLRMNGHPYAEAEFNFVYKTIKPDQILDTSRLTESDFSIIREKGISRKMAKTFGIKYPAFVPYYKGQDSDFNRWYSRVDFYIDWSEDNVAWMRENSGKKFQGAPVVRSPHFYFKPSFCWNRVRTFNIKSSLISKPGVSDSNCLSLSSNLPFVQNSYFSAWLNQFNTANIFEILSTGPMAQINDVKMLPFIIPPVSLSNSIHIPVMSLIQILSEEQFTKSKSIDRISQLESNISKQMDVLSWNDLRKAS